MGMPRPSAVLAAGGGTLTLVCAFFSRAANPGEETTSLAALC